ncbi:MAG: M20/M25/M40 family metallo-hydrolase, partial [Pseudomonadota bacterium]
MNIVQCFTMVVNSQNYDIYKKYLREIISINTVSSNDDGICKALEYCKREILLNLPNWDINHDSKGNLIALNPDFEQSKPALFLSAHIDTVDAKTEQWVSSENPFTALETTTHIIGRGANDCKAGVALILFMSFLIKQNLFLHNNIGFLISYREEGNREKT